MKNNLYIMLPAFNEEKNIDNVLGGISRDLANLLEKTKVIIIDDGSKDNTIKKCEEYQNKLDQIIIKNEINLGLPKTLEIGFKYCIDLAEDNDVIVCMDCDSSHLAKQIHDMISHIENGYDIVIASRYQNSSRIEGVTEFRKILSYGASFLFSNLIRIPNLKDYSSGYRAYRAKNLKAAFNLEAQRIFSLKGFACSTAIILSVFRLTKAKITEIPIDLRYDKKQGASKIRIFTTVIATLRLLLFEMKKNHG